VKAPFFRERRKHELRRVAEQTNTKKKTLVDVKKGKGKRITAEVENTKP